MKRYVRIFALLLAIVTLFSTTTFQTYATTTDLNNKTIDTQKQSLSFDADNSHHKSEDGKLLYDNETQLKLDSITKDSAILNYIDAKTLASGGHVSRCPELESLSSYVFKNADGTRTAYFMDHPVKYIASDGTVKEIDLTLKEKTTGKGYETTSSAVSLNIGSLYSDGVTVYLGTIPVTLTASQSPDSSAVKRSASTETVSTVTTNVSEYALTYNNLFGNGTEVRYTPTYNGVKEEIVISEYKGTNSFTFTLDTNGLGVFNEDGIYYVASSQNSKERISLGQTVVYDSKDNICDGTMSVSTVTDRSLYTITVSAPLDFLLDSDTVYPVIIDPEMTVSDTESQTGLIEDSPIYELKPTINFGAYTFNRVGLASGSYGIGRTVVRLTGLINSPIYQSIDSSQINSVKFYVKESSGHTGRVVDICPLTENSTWTESGVKWENAGAFGSVVSSSTWTSNSFGEFDITQLVRGWKNGTYNEDCGFIMKGADETVNESFLSSEYSANIAYRPYVVFSYTPYISVTGSTTVLENGTSILTVTTQPSASQVTFSSSNTSVARVSSTGVVTGVRAGKATVTASFTAADGNTYSDTHQMIVIYPDGVYRIQNYSGLYLTSAPGISDGTNVMQSLRNDTAAGRFRQMWKLKHIGQGYYSVRPMHKLSSALDITQNNADIWQIGTSDTVSGVPSYARWTIEYVSSGYVFHPNGNETRALALTDSNANSGTNVESKTFTPNENTNRWNFSKFSIVPSGIHLYNKSEETIITTVPRKHMFATETKTLDDFNLKVVPYSGNTISQSVNWSSDNTQIASVSGSGIVTAHSAGIVTITASRTYQGVTDSTSYTIVVTGAYYIKNVEHNKFLQIDDANPSESGQNAEMHKLRSGNVQQWNLIPLGDGYFKIVSNHSGYALSVPSGKTSSQNIALVQESYTGATRQQWQITELANGNFKIKPRSASSSPDLVMAVGTGSTNGVNIEQRTYINDDNYKDEWELIALYVDVTLIGIQDDEDVVNEKGSSTESEHDHFSCYSSVMSSINSMGNYGFNLYDTNYIAHTECLEIIAKSRIFVIRTHGGCIENTTFITLNDDGQTASMLHDFQIFNYEDNTRGADLSNCELILFIGCNTAQLEDTSLPYAAVSAGASVAIGFEDEIGCSAANEWVEYFFEYYSQGFNIVTSCYKAKNSIDSLDGIDSYIVVRAE